jgi:hypothetical protein
MTRTLTLVLNLTLTLTITLFLTLTLNRYSPIRKNLEVITHTPSIHYVLPSFCRLYQESASLLERPFGDCKRGLGYRHIHFVPIYRPVLTLSTMSLCCCCPFFERFRPSRPFTRLGEPRNLAISTAASISMPAASKW